MPQVTSEHAHRVVCQIMQDGVERTMAQVKHAAQLSVQSDGDYITPAQVRYCVQRLVAEGAVTVTPWARGWFKEYRYQWKEKIK